MSRFAEILRRGGELDGVRVMRPETLRAATKECRRLRPDIATDSHPARWGTGYMLGNKRFGPFGRNAPAAFGNTGLTNIAVWADPERGLAAGLISSGKPGGHPRGQPLSRAAGPHHRRDPASADLLAVDPLDGQRHQHPAVGHHHRPVLVPVWVLACRPAVVVDQRLDLRAVRVGSRPVSVTRPSAVAHAQPSGLVTSRAARGSRRRFAVLARPSVIDT